jgi:RNA polymerase sigma-70 factor (ECF subfamily)
MSEAVTTPLPKGRDFSLLPAASIAGRCAFGQDTLREGSIGALRQEKSNRKGKPYIHSRNAVVLRPRTIKLGRRTVAFEGGKGEIGWCTSVGDEAQSAGEFEQRVRECHRLVFHVAYAVLADRADAEEVVQDAFFRAYRKLSGLREPQKFRSWVARMGYRLALNRWRAATRALRRDSSWHEMSAGAEANAENIVAQREVQRRLREEIDRLPKKLRAVVILSAVEELDTRDIAGVLRIPEGTVRSRLHLARKALLKAFTDEPL